MLWTLKWLRVAWL